MIGVEELQRTVENQRAVLARLQADPEVPRLAEKLKGQREHYTGLIEEQRRAQARIHAQLQAALRQAQRERLLLRAEVALLRSGRFLRRRRVITASRRHWQAKWAMRAVAP